MTDAAADDALREQLTDTMRRVRPRIVFVCTVDGDKRKMDTGGGKSVRYSQLARVIVAMGPTVERVELCNPKGELIEQWHPRGQLIEDEPADVAGAALEVPAGLAQLPAELVGQVLNLCLAFSANQARDTQRAVDHAVDRHSLGQKQLLAGFIDQQKGTNEQLAYLQRQQTQTLKLVQQALHMQADARGVALDAQRLASGEDPNSPDAVFSDFARTLLGRQLGPGAAADAAAPQSRPMTTKKDSDEN